MPLVTKEVVKYTADPALGIITKLTRLKVRDVEAGTETWVTYEKNGPSRIDQVAERAWLVGKQQAYQDLKQEFTNRIADLDAAIALLP